MAALRKWSMVVALALILSSFLILLQHTEFREKPRRNISGTVLSVYQAARAAGATVEGGSVEEVVKQLMDGVKGSGDFHDTNFRVPQLSSGELDAVLRKLTVVDGVLTACTAVDDPP